MNLKITPFKKKLPLVCVQGLGVVGSAMALAVAASRRNKQPQFNVIGLEKKKQDLEKNIFKK